MLFLIFSIGPKNYTLSSRDIIEIIPNLICKDNAPPNELLYYAGLVNYHGTQLPIVDLCLLLNETACPKLLSSRIILIQPPQNCNYHGPIGLLAEKITETTKIDVPKKIDHDSPQFRTFIESKISRPGKIIKLFDLEKILPDNLHEVLNIS